MSPHGARSYQTRILWLEMRASRRTIDLLSLIPAEAHPLAKAQSITILSQRVKHRMTVLKHMTITFCSITQLVPKLCLRQQRISNYQKMSSMLTVFHVCDYWRLLSQYERSVGLENSLLQSRKESSFIQGHSFSRQVLNLKLSCNKTAFLVRLVMILIRHTLTNMPKCSSRRSCKIIG